MKRLFFIFSIFAGLSHASGQNLDIRILNSINGGVSSSDKTWKGISNSAYLTITAVPATMLITGLATHDRELTVKSLETTGSILIAEGFTLALKKVTHRQRPYLAYPNLITAKTSATDYSFPSGHTSTVFATATSLSLSFPKWYVIVPSFAYAGTVGYSRMYLGAHYPSDVLAGALLGAGSSFLTWKLQKILNKKYHYH